MEEMTNQNPEVPMGYLTAKRNGIETSDIFAFGSPATVGRFDPSVGPIDIDLSTLAEGTYVSRRHAKIEFADGEWTITDLSSSNGTYILNSDFEKVETASLTDGCEIAFGNARFVFHTGMPPQADVAEQAVVEAEPAAVEDVNEPEGVHEPVQQGELQQPL